MKERFVDILLLKIIQANDQTNNIHSDEDRLALSKQALFGMTRSVGREPHNDDKAMLSITQNELKEYGPTLSHEFMGAKARLMGECMTSAPMEQISIIA